MLPRLGATPLRELDPLSLTAFRAELTAARIGPASTRRVMVILQGVLERAVEWQRIPSNPARAVRKPAQRRERAVRPLPPLDIERIRAHLVDDGRMRDAVLVSVLAYAGLRPGEALALRWSHIRERTILVEHAVAFGQVRRRRLRAPVRSACLRRLLRTYSSGGSAGVGRLKTHSSSLVAAEASGATMRGSTGDGASSGGPLRQPASTRPCDRTTCATRSCRFYSPREPTWSRSRGKPAIRRR